MRVSAARIIGAELRIMQERLAAATHDLDRRALQRVVAELASLHSNLDRERRYAAERKQRARDKRRAEQVEATGVLAELHTRSALADIGLGSALERESQPASRDSGTWEASRRTEQLVTLRRRSE